MKPGAVGWIGDAPAELPADARAVFDALATLGIAVRALAHPPTADMAACGALDGALGALTPKNIFLTPKNHSRYYLCLTRPEARFRTADISKQAGASRLSFAPEGPLRDLLRCRPGAASPLGLLFDRDRRVALLVDRALREVPTLGFHPCDNTLTVAMSGRDFFEVFLPSVRVEPIDVEIHDFLE